MQLIPKVPEYLKCWVTLSPRAAGGHYSICFSPFSSFIPTPLTTTYGAYSSKRFLPFISMQATKPGFDSIKEASRHSEVRRRLGHLR